MTIITDTEALAEFCARQDGADFVAVDTEFMRERTYWPILCLVQVAGPAEAAAIDALAPGIDLAPLLALMADERTLEGVPRGAPGRRNFLQPDRRRADAAVRHPDRGHGLRVRRRGQL